MGIFSSEYKTTVATGVSRVINDKLLPDSVKAGVIKSLIGGDPLVESIMEDVITSIGVRAGRMYEYGKTQYTYGLPEGTLFSSADGESTVTVLLQELYGSSLTVDYYHFGPFNNLHYAWQTLVQNYGYVAATNQLDTFSAEKGRPVYLKDMAVVVSETNLALREAGSLDQWGVAPNSGVTPQRPGIGQYGAYLQPSPIRVEPGSGDDYVRVSYVWKDAQNIIQENTLDIPIPLHSEAADYYQVRYTLTPFVEEPSEVAYWTYQVGSGGYPDLDTFYTPDINGLGSFFPFIHLRHNKTSMAADTNSEGYKTSKKLTKYLGLDYDQIVDAVHENPDIADVENALIVMAVPAKTNAPLEQRYLFDFFNRIYVEAGGLGTQGVGGQESIASGFTAQQAHIFLGDSPNRISFIIQDARFKMAVSLSSIFKRKKAGTIGAVASYSSQLGYVEEFRRTVTGNEFEVTEWVERVPVYYYRHQISSGIYEEIQIYGLTTAYFIWGEYITAGRNTDDILLIPLDSSITDMYSIPVRETLYSRSLHYVFNSRIVTKVAWYQSDFFQFVLIVVAIVMILNGIPADILLTIAANSLFVNVVMLGFYLAVYVVKMVAIKLFIKLVGLKIALVVAVIAAMMGMYQVLQAGSIQGAPWAKDLLALANGLSSGVQKSLSEMMSGLADEASTFTVWMDKQTKLLDTAKELLETNRTLSPFVIFGESPDDYYNRTVHSGNIGLNGIEAISSYVQIALTLPKLNETIGLENNGY